MDIVLEQVKKLQSHKGVEGVLMIRAADGSVVYTTMKEDDALKYGTFARDVVNNMTENLSTLYATSGSDDLALLRIRTIKHEVMIAREHEFLLVAIHAPQGS